ncbi:hypothetical protein GCM10010387_22510 [Streptomyces inusitatus]|uniref:Uncharacterized protein n=1 Tax=Streptomyces inusitatus TaxID=68221 RepID=A0A918PZD2_9ACTN|nr:hypothetical protein [Streptomyces inusitatus]GGZ28544.1 hypothetical protein GCM10010387_22510 [Streptomyces inusitatus]
MNDHRVLLDAYAAQAATNIPPGTIRQWLRRGRLTHHGYDQAGRALIDLNELRDRVAQKAA